METTVVYRGSWGHRDEKRVHPESCQFPFHFLFLFPTDILHLYPYITPYSVVSISCSIFFSSDSPLLGNYNINPR